VAYSRELADSIRIHIGDHPGLTEREMFGGIAFLIGGNMAVGVTGDELMVRVGKDAHAESIALPGARVFDFSSRPMKGWLVVAAEGIATPEDLEAWIERGVGFAETLPPK
jgi:TfoX/Sxy family transcriptional regulator of competence genes